MNTIPEMDDPLGKHWDQPRDIRTALMDEKYVILTARQVKQLCSYDRSLPSGVYPGKCWLRHEPGPVGPGEDEEDVPSRRLLAWYGEETANHHCPILFREVLEV